MRCGRQGSATIRPSRWCLRELPSLHMQRTRDHTAGRALQSTSEPSAYSMPNPLCTNASNRVFSQAAKFKTLGFWACRVERETVSALNDPRVGPGSDPTQPRVSTMLDRLLDHGHLLKCGPEAGEPRQACRKESWQGKNNSVSDGLRR